MFAQDLCGVKLSDRRKMLEDNVSARRWMRGVMYARDLRKTVVLCAVTDGRNRRPSSFEREVGSAQSGRAEGKPSIGYMHVMHTWFDRVCACAQILLRPQ